jgi:hypothetical protein
MAESRLYNKFNIPINKWSFVPSLILLLISIVFGYIFQFIAGWFMDVGQYPNFTETLKYSDRLLLYPVFAYLVFLGCVWWVKNELDKKLMEGKLSETEITKIIDKWSGIVDGIGTALPLIGAAVILFTVGLGKGSESQNLFLKFAVPFEIKSLFILAIARLFESAFDGLEIQYLANVVDTQAKTVPEILQDLKIELINLPDTAALTEINKILLSWNDTVQNMKDTNFEKSLENIIKITGR